VKEDFNKYNHQPAHPTQDGSLSPKPNNCSEMFSSRKSTNAYDNKKDSISLRRSRKVETAYRQTMIIP
jgi:hypothetical protein